MKKTLLISFLVVLIDQFIKLTVSSKMFLFESITIIKNFFSITFVKNFGAAYSLFNGNRIFLILISIVSLFFIIMYISKHKENINNIFYGLLIGGIIGNLIDRVFNGYVIDFLDFKIFGYDFPVFNIADICIVISIFLIIFFSRDDKNENKG